MRWLVYGGFVLFVLLPAFAFGLLFNSVFVDAVELQVSEKPAVVLLAFEWSYLTSIYVGLVVLFGGVRLLSVSWRVFGWRFCLAFLVWLGLVAGVLWWGGFLDAFFLSFG